MSALPTQQMAKTNNSSQFGFKNLPENLRRKMVDNNVRHLHLEVLLGTESIKQR
ncbi:hypothetical protein [Parendozoicomonas sp. Alg238-R29]|uniref:hypothetical protein n=1 Tax=Parendozoicomonas sp. Alg238-R29 TaxID=2993446 RepID=UPI00248DAF61|nr:hypothetical protein [Parendozoicomonas sp. Alg238-R29]